ncbi:unnamed protein product, partial [Polarella glacialis]
GLSKSEARRLRKEQRKEQRRLFSREHRLERKKAQKRRRQEARQTLLASMDTEERTVFVEAEREAGRVRKAEWDATLNHAYDSGRPRVAINCSFSNTMGVKELTSLGKQVQLAYTHVRDLRSKVQLHVTSLGADNSALRSLEAVGMRSWRIHTHTEAVWDIFAEEARAGRLVVLTPDADEDLDQVLEDEVYVIGGIVDRSVVKLQSLTQAEQKGVTKLRRLPLKSRGRGCSGGALGSETCYAGHVQSKAQETQPSEALIADDILIVAEGSVEKLGVRLNWQIVWKHANLPRYRKLKPYKTHTLGWSDACYIELAARVLPVKAGRWSAMVYACVAMELCLAVVAKASHLCIGRRVDLIGLFSNRAWAVWENVRRCCFRKVNFETELTAGLLVAMNFGRNPRGSQPRQPDKLSKPCIEEMPKVDSHPNPQVSELSEASGPEPLLKKAESPLVELLVKESEASGAVLLLEMAEAFPLLKMAERDNHDRHDYRVRDTHDYDRERRESDHGYRTPARDRLGRTPAPDRRRSSSGNHRRRDDRPRSRTRSRINVDETYRSPVTSRRDDLGDRESPPEDRRETAPRIMSKRKIGEIDLHPDKSKREQIDILTTALMLSFDLGESDCMAVADIISRCRLHRLSDLAWITDDELKNHVMTSDDSLYLRTTVRGIVAKIKRESEDKIFEKDQSSSSIIDREAIIGLKESIKAMAASHEKKDRKKSDGINRRDESDDETPTFDLAASLKGFKISYIPINWFGDIRKLSKFHKFLEKAKQSGRDPAPCSRPVDDFIFLWLSHAAVGICQFEAVIAHILTFAKMQDRFGLPFAVKHERRLLDLCHNRLKASEEFDIDALIFPCVEIVTEIQLLGIKHVEEKPTKTPPPPPPPPPPEGAKGVAAAAAKAKAKAKAVAMPGRKQICFNHDPSRSGVCSLGSKCSRDHLDTTVAEPLARYDAAKSKFSSRLLAPNRGMIPLSLRNSSGTRGLSRSLDPLRFHQSNALWRLRHPHLPPSFVIPSQRQVARGRRSSHGHRQTVRLGISNPCLGKREPSDCSTGSGGSIGGSSDGFVGPSSCSSTSTSSSRSSSPERRDPVLDIIIPPDSASFEVVSEAHQSHLKTAKGRSEDIAAPATPGKSIVRCVDRISALGIEGLITHRRQHLYDLRRMSIELRPESDLLLPAAPEHVRNVLGSPFGLKISGRHGGLGGLVVSSKIEEWFECSAPKSFINALDIRKTQIFAFETLAVLISLMIWGLRFQGRRIIFFIDNSSALGVLRKGSSKSQDVHSLITEFWDIAARRHISVFLRWVPSKLNLSDRPSRGVAPIALAASRSLSAFAQLSSWLEQSNFLSGRPRLSFVSRHSSPVAHVCRQIIEITHNRATLLAELPESAVGRLIQESEHLRLPLQKAIRAALSSVGVESHSWKDRVLVPIFPRCRV